jgi:hypothetical protein
MTKTYYSPRPQYFDQNGKPLSGGRLSFYEADTTTLKNIYTTHELNVAAQNPHILDSYGYVQDNGIWLEPGAYKIVLEQNIRDDEWKTLWTVDFFELSSSDTSTLLETAFISTIDELRNLSLGTYQFVYVQGYYSRYDNGGGWFYYDANSNTDDNGGTVIAPAGVPALGRYRRILNDNEIRPEMFGAIPNNNSISVAGNFTEMINWCSANPQYNAISVQPGEYNLNGNVTFDGDINLKIYNGVKFVSNSLNSLVTIDCPYEIESDEAIVERPRVNLSILNTDVKVKFVWFNPATGVLSNSSYVLEHVISATDPSAQIEITQGHMLDDNISTPRVYNFNGGYFVIESPAPTIAIEDIITDDKDVLQGQFENVTISKNIIPISWFRVAPSNIINITAYNKLLEVAERKILKWDSESYTFNDTPSSSLHDLVTHDFTNRPLLTINSSVPVNFAKFLANGQFISVDSTSYISTKNNDLKPSYYGALSDLDDATSTEINAKAIEKCMLGLAESHRVNDTDVNSSISVNGDGATYVIVRTLNLNLSDTAISNGRGVRLKNMEIIATAEVTTAIFSINGSLITDNVKITSNSNVIAFYNTYGTSYQDDLGPKILNSTFDTSIGLVTSGAGIHEIKDCSFLCNTALSGDAYTVNVIGNTFKAASSDELIIYDNFLDLNFSNNVLDNNGFGTPYVSLKSSSSGSSIGIFNSNIVKIDMEFTGQGWTICNNTFDRSPELIGASYSNFNSNILQFRQVSLNASTSNYAISGFNAQNNQFFGLIGENGFLLLSNISSSAVHKDNIITNNITNTSAWNINQAGANVTTNNVNITAVEDIVSFTYNVDDLMILPSIDKGFINAQVYESVNSSAYVPSITSAFYVDGSDSINIQKDGYNVADSVIWKVYLRSTDYPNFTSAPEKTGTLTLI